jgi:hypothetical protein
MAARDIVGHSTPNSTPERPHFAGFESVFEKLQGRSGLEIMQAAGRFSVRAVRNAKTGLVDFRDDPLIELNRWHGWTGLSTMEGFMRPGQAEWVRKLLDDSPDIQNIAEVGFNGGHSSFAMLEARKDVKVTSFDIGLHSYVRNTAEYIDGLFPDRHRLVLGDSTRTVPDYAGNAKDDKFDLIFIDGGHDFDTAMADLINMHRLASGDCVVVMDDYNPAQPWGKGPTQAWDNAVRDGLVYQQGIFSADNRTWAVGRYLR